MHVIKRNGEKAEVNFDAILDRISECCQNLDSIVNPVVMAQKVVSGVYPGVTTRELDEMAAQTAASCTTQHPDFNTLASRLSISDMQKQTMPKFSDVVKVLYKHVHPKTGHPAPLVSDDVYKITLDNAELIDSRIDDSRDFNFDYFGFKTLEKSYLMMANDVVMERPQYMFMRVALGIHGSDLEGAFETYDHMSNKDFIHASPTLFNAGTQRPQLSSCFLLTMKDDSIEGIYDTLHLCASISKLAGGIGLSCHHIRAMDSYGGGKRKGSFAVYLEPWHADIFDFLDLKKNHGNELERARDLFYALWIPDLFMECVQANGDWCLFCPNEAPGLCDVWGDEFNALYKKYMSENRQRKTISAQKLWYAILESQTETGTPYVLFKDACNRKSNQQNLGTIRSSNLCTEIIEYTSPDEVAVCNLASISLTNFVNDSQSSYDFEGLYNVAKVITRNLNKVIDVNYYPVEEARKSNMRHRPIGMGVQGLADTFCKLRLPFESTEAKQLNKDIFETIYFGGMEASIELAEKDGHYETFPGSPTSKGQFQFDLWNIDAKSLSGRWDWEGLRTRMVKSGVRNSLLLAPMPTASTAQILGNNESTEPFTSNMYNRRVLAGEFPVVNKYLLNDLVRLELWTPELRNELIAAMGSTVWEIKQKNVIDQAADRGPFICQSQSLNIHMAEPTTGKLTSMHFHAWRSGLKTRCHPVHRGPKRLDQESHHAGRRRRLPHVFGLGLCISV
eukprot:GSChrysophyteH2.ASY1.ANO1.551.1 assembled CDS